MSLVCCRCSRWIRWTLSSSTTIPTSSPAGWSTWRGVPSRSRPFAPHSESTLPSATEGMFFSLFWPRHRFLFALSLWVKINRGSNLNMQITYQWMGQECRICSAGSAEVGCLQSWWSYHGPSESSWFVSKTFTFNLEFINSLHCSHFVFSTTLQIHFFY